MGVIDELPARVRVSRQRRIVDQCHQMARCGVLARAARVELIEGQVIARAPIGTKQSFGAAASISRQGRIRMGKHEKILQQVLLGRSDSNFGVRDER